MDKALLARAAKRDADAFAEAVTSQIPLMYKTARSILFSDEDAADAIQETILTCWEKIDQLKKPAAFRAWMIRVLINCCYDIIRTASRSESISEEYAYCESGFERAEWELLLSDIEETYRIPLMLHYAGGFKTKEIAEILAIPDATVRTRLKRGRDKLKRLLQGEERESCRLRPEHRQKA